MIEAPEPADLQTEASGVYLPSPAEIAAACAAIRAEWSEAEERSRRVIGNPSPEVRRVTSAASED